MLKPAQIAEVKARGFLINRGTENFSGRVVPKGSVFTAEDLRTLSDLAEKFGSGKVVFTSRLTAEIVGIPFDRIDAACDYAAARGLYFGGTGAKIRPITACDPTLTFNTIGRHQSMLVHTRVASTGSPWLSKCEVGEMHTIAISHGEGRFVAPQEVLDTMLRNGQVATQYVDLTGVPTMDQSFNPNGSVLAIEGITSPDGRVFGKMGHSERSGNGLYVNVPGNKYQPIFEAGVEYFTA